MLLLSYHLARSSTTMVFPYYLNTEEMALYVWETFNWHLRSAARPAQPPPEDHYDLCADFILANAQEATWDFCLPELVEATFYAVVVNDALELGMLSRGLAPIMKSVLTGLPWFIFEGWLQQNRDSILRACQPSPAAAEARLGPSSGQDESIDSNRALLHPMMRTIDGLRLSGVSFFLYIYKGHVMFYTCNKEWLFRSVTLVFNW